MKKKCFKYKDRRKTKFLEVFPEVLGQELSIHYIPMKGRDINMSLSIP